MEKIINVSVTGSEIEQSSGYGGIQGEGGARSLKITFDEEWSTYSKSVTFLDAAMENAVKVILTTASLNDDGSYLVPIPSAPLAAGGKFTYIIDGSADGVLQRSVKKELKVKYAPVVSSADLPSAVTPSQADQLNLSIQKESKRIDVLEQEAEGAKGDIADLTERITVTEEKAEGAEETVLGMEARVDALSEEVSKKAGSAYVEDALSKKADITYVDSKTPQKASEEQAAEALDDEAYMTPSKTGKQIKTVLAATLVNTPEIYTKESMEGMNAISGMKHGDMCIIISADTSAQSIYRYYTKDINGNALTTPQWVWLTDLSLFAPLPVLQLYGEPQSYESTNYFVRWDYSKGNTAKFDFSSQGGDIVSFNITNIKSGDYGILDVYNDAYNSFEGLLPENSYAFPPDWDYLAPLDGQHYRYSFFFDGSKFDWNRSVRANE